MRLLFSCRPGDGHFTPLVPLAEAARRRGHTVWFASSEPALTKARRLGFHGERAGIDDTES